MTHGCCRWSSAEDGLLPDMSSRAHVKYYLEQTSCGSKDFSRACWHGLRTIQCFVCFFPLYDFFRPSTRRKTSEPAGNRTIGTFPTYISSSIESRLSIYDFNGRHHNGTKHLSLTLLALTSNQHHDSPSQHQTHSPLSKHSTFAR